MIYFKRIIIVLMLVFSALYSSAQVLRQFNGVVLIKDITVIITNVETRCVLEYNDPAAKYTGENAMVGDHIVDVTGNAFEITVISSASSSEINVTLKSLDGVDISPGTGVIYRSTSKGIDLLGLSDNSTLVGTVVNSALLRVNTKIPTITSGTIFPLVSATVGDVGIYNGSVYRYGSSGWEPVTNIPYTFGLNSGTVGDIVVNLLDGSYYVCTGGASWNPLFVLTELPIPPKIGDVFYNTNENKLYMMGNNGIWLSISSSGVPSGPIGDRPTVPKAGDFFFNTDDNILFVYDSLGRWVEVSINGSTPTGIMNPDPTLATVKEGELFYNSTDHKAYIYNGSSWVGLNNSLLNGQIFIGNSSNVPVSVPLSGDATINNIGQLTIKNGVVTNSKLDKANIPLDGFGYANNNIVIGTTSPFYQIKGIANPTNPEDAATKSYVDLSFSSPFMLGLANNSVFVGNSSNKAVAVLKSVVPISDFGKATSSVSMGTAGGPYYNISNLANPVSTQDAATKYYVDNHMVTPSYITLANNQILVGGATGIATAVAKSATPFSDFGAATADIFMGGKTLKNLHEPTNPQDAATMNYVDSKTLTLTDKYVFVGDATNMPVGVTKTTIPFSDWGAANANVSMGGTNLTDLANPRLTVAGLQDAATRKYVDDKVGSVTTGTTPPTSPVVGATYYNTTDKTMYVYDGTSWIPVDNKLPNGQLYVGDATNKAVATSKSAISLSGFGDAQANVSMGTGSNNYKIINVADPTGDQDAATKKYVDGKVGSIITGTTPPTNPAVGATYYNTTDKTFYVYDGTSWIPVDNKLANGQLYVGDATNKAVSTAKNAIPLSGFAAAAADVALGGFKLTGVSDPAADQDAATKKYVDGKTGGLTTGTTPPISPTVGATYYNTTDKTFYVYDGTSWIPVDNKLTNGQLYVGDAANKAVSTAKNTIPLSGFAAAAADIDLGTHKIVNVVDPAADQDAATKKYVDGKTGGLTTGTTPPINPTVGTTYYNTTDKTFYVYDGTSWIPVDNKLPNGQLYVGDASNKAAATLKNTIPLSGFAAAAADIDLGTYKIVNVVDPAADQDAATKKYVDGKTAGLTTGTTSPINPTVGATYYNTTDKTFYVYDGTSWIPVDNKLPNGQLYVGDASNKAVATLKNTIPLSGFAAAAADIDLGTHKIINVVDPAADQDAATKKYVDNLLATINSTLSLPQGNMLVGDASGKAASTAKSAITLSGFGDAQANVSMGTGSNNYKIINVANPTGDQDAATKKYVDGKTAGVTTGTNPPPGTIVGSTYYNTTDKTLYVYDGTGWIPAVPGDNLGNHTATQNIKMVTYAINSDGVDGKGLTFETAGNAVFAQDVTVKGNFYTPSDRRLKTNIETLGNALQGINSMRGVRFEYKDQRRYAKGPKIGVIAQELMKVYPEMVTKGADGFFKVDYTQLTGVLIQAVKEQQQEINQLKDRLDKQQMQIDAILKKIN
jgi:hypothetical protein